MTKPSPVRRPSPALVISVIALFVACTGTAVAIQQITSAEIQNRTIKLKDLSAKARAKLQGKAGPEGPRGPQGERGLQGLTGSPGPSVFDGGSIPSGTTVRGVWGGRYIAALGGSMQDSYLLPYSFPLPAQEPLTDGDVNFGADTLPPVGDPDNACQGSVDNPIAPPGKVCIYVNQATRANTHLTGFKLTAADGSHTADRYGFQARVINLANDTTMRAEGTWAFTAP